MLATSYCKVVDEAMPLFLAHKLGWKLLQAKSLKAPPPAVGSSEF